VTEGATSGRIVPVAHSVIEASFLAGEVARRYALPGPLKSFLL
jgi:hypothetical protein